MLKPAVPAGGPAVGLPIIELVIRSAFEFVPGTVAYAGCGPLHERRGWDGQDWIAGQGGYLNSSRGFFLKLSYLYRF